MAMDCRIGTSGWQYPHWKGIFYPEGLKNAYWLSFYGQHFDTLEINATFYREIKPTTYEKWFNTVPHNFLFSIKMTKYVTHFKKLKAEAASVKRFTENVLSLRYKLAVVLIQLPPGLAFDAPLMEDFFGLLDHRIRYTVEARNKTYIDDRFFSMLEGHKIAWCIADSAGRFPYYEIVTGPFVYARLHGSQNLYVSNYRDEELVQWADKIESWKRPAYVYFDNDSYGYAVTNALKLKALLSGRSSGVYP